MAKREEILALLNDFLQMDDVLACMVTKKGLEGIVPDTTKVNDINLWQLISKTTGEIFDIVTKFYAYKPERFYFKLAGYNIVVAPISEIFSLIVVVPSLANMGFIDLEIENMKAKIKKILERPD